MSAELTRYITDGQASGMTWEEIARGLSDAGWTMERLVAALYPAQADPRAVITVSDVHKSFGKVRALGGVSLSVMRGEVLALLGPNGAGKTTLVRILATLMEQNAGTVSVGGFDNRRDSRNIRTLIGLAGQNAAVDETLTGRENLELIGRLYHLPRSIIRDRASALLAQFELEDAGDRAVKTYSGGMRRRLDLAASLVNDPHILFLDEPTTGLDPQSRNALWKTIKGLVSRGTTVLLTTQYMEEADHLADRIVVINHGLVIAEGTPDELKDRIGSNVVRIHFADGTEETRPAPRGAADLIAVVRELDGAHVALADISLSRPTLDDVFLKLTGRTVESTDHE